MKKVLFLMMGVFMPVVSFGQVFAISPGDWYSIQNNSVYYNGQPQSCSPLCSGNLVNIDASKAVWTSSVSQPYYLEEFAINVLEDLSKTTNVVQSNALTQQHVLALVAWFWAEGGDIANTDLFNPLNSSQAVAGSTVQTTGDMAYVSFDSGVQALVQTMLGSYQSRIAEALTNPNSSATQIMQAVTYYQNYPGNLHWASSDSPTNQQAYLNALLANVTQATSNYNYEASTEMGTSSFEISSNMHVPFSELTYSSISNNGSPGSGSGTIPAPQTCSDSNPAVATIGGVSGYANPLRSVSNLKSERIDQGVDYAGAGPVYALGNGTITSLINTGWNFGGYDAFIAEKLSDGPASGDYAYVAEACVPVSGLSIGATVTSSTQICTMINPGSSGIETGWANPPGSGESLAYVLNQWNGSDSTALGQNYSQLLVSLGAPAGVMDGSVIGTLPSGWPVW